MTSNNDNPSYYAIIPASVRYDPELKPNAKLLYGEITALCNKEGYCWASNNYFAQLYSVSKETISRWVSQLHKNGHIVVEIKNKNGSDKSRKIRIAHDEKIKGVLTKTSMGIDEKIKCNTTSNNTTTIREICDLGSAQYFEKPIIEDKLSKYTNDELKLILDIAEKLQRGQIEKGLNQFGLKKLVDNSIVQYKLAKPKSKFDGMIFDNIGKQNG